MDAIRAVLGLGNPGADYSRSRHNLGFMVVHRLAERARLRFRKEDPTLEACTGRPGRGAPDVVLARPLTFMNRSGRAASQLESRHGVRPEELLVVLDDLDLPFGRLRLRTRGGAGTHNGLRSVLDALGEEGLPRLRMGIGSADPSSDLADWVLDDFRDPEMKQLPEFLDQAADCVEMVIRYGLQAAMNRFNPTS